VLRVGETEISLDDAVAGEILVRPEQARAESHPPRPA
jgi:hypothetical protein